MEIQFIFDPKHKETLSGRVRTACLTCRRRKTKCDGMAEGDLSCRICREKGIECEGFPKRKRPQRASKPEDDRKSAKRRDNESAKRISRRIDPQLRHGPQMGDAVQGKATKTRTLSTSAQPDLAEPLPKARSKCKSIVKDKSRGVKSHYEVLSCSPPLLDLDMLPHTDLQNSLSGFEMCVSDSEHTDFEQGVSGSQFSDWEHDLWPLSELDRRGSSSSTASDLSMQNSQPEQVSDFCNSVPAEQQHDVARRIQPPVIRDLDKEFLIEAPLSMLDNDAWPHLSAQELIGNIPLGWEEGCKSDMLANFPAQLFATDQISTPSIHAHHASLADYDGALFAWPER